MVATNGIFFLLRWQTIPASPGMEEMATLRVDSYSKWVPHILFAQGSHDLYLYPYKINNFFHSQNHYRFNEKSYGYTDISHFYPKVKHVHKFEYSVVYR